MQAVSMHCMYSVTRAEYIDRLHDTKGSGAQKQKMKCTSCKLLYREILKFYTSTKRVCKKYGVQSQGYKILSLFLAMAVRLVHASTSTIDCHTK